MPSSNIATIAPAEIFVLLGPARITGFAEGTYFTAEKVNDDEAFVEGSDGEGVFIANPSNAWAISLVLMQSSRSNDTLWGIRQANRQTPGGILSTLKVSHAGTNLVSAKTKIVKPAAVTFSNGVETRTWNLIATFFEGSIAGITS